MAAADDAIRALPVAYHDLLARARAVFEPDERVRGLWLGGSLARGTADAASDLDLLVAVADDAHAAFTAGWRGWLADITPTVLAQTLPFAPGILSSLTPTCERLDVVVEAVSAVPTTMFRRRVVVFDRDDLTAVLPEPEPGPPPSADGVRALVTEWFRISAVETILVRDDWLLAREHLHVQASLVHRLFLEANAPLPPMGIKQWSARLTPPQRAALASLPTAVSGVDELRAAHLVASAVFLTNAEVLAGRLGVAWPAELEAATAAHLRRHLGLDEPHPRGGPLVV